jgi:hypothetical protein
MILSAVTLLTLTAVTPPTGSEMLFGDAAAGARLHATQCVGCHDSSVYTRKERKIHSLEGLIRQVNFCNTQLKRQLTKDNIDDLVRYLNDTYYRYP